MLLYYSRCYYHLMVLHPNSSLLDSTSKLFKHVHNNSASAVEHVYKCMHKLILCQVNFSLDMGVLF